MYSIVFFKNGVPVNTALKQEMKSRRNIATERTESIGKGIKLTHFPLIKARPITASAAQLRCAFAQLCALSHAQGCPVSPNVRTILSRRNTGQGVRNLSEDLNFGGKSRSGLKVRFDI